MTDKPHLSGWCSPHCTPRSHKTCSERLRKHQLDRCDCEHHTKETN